MPCYSLSTLETINYSRRFRRQFVAENGDCCRIRRQSPFSVTVAEIGDYSLQRGQGFILRNCRLSASATAVSAERCCEAGHWLAENEAHHASLCTGYRGDIQSGNSGAGFLYSAQRKRRNGENNRTLTITLFLTLNLTLNDCFRLCAVCVAPNTQMR